jgi:hypothetical protein
VAAATGVILDEKRIALVAGVNTSDSFRYRNTI